MKFEQLQECSWGQAHFTIDLNDNIVPVENYKLGSRFYVGHQGPMTKINGVHMSHSDAEKLGFKPYREKIYYTFDEAVQKPGKYECYVNRNACMERYQMNVYGPDRVVEFRIGAITDWRPQIALRKSLLYTRISE